VLAIVALAVGVVALGFVLFSSGSDYTVTADFQNASQLVKGNQVVIGGSPVGSVQEISLGDHGDAMVKFSVESDYAPLREGTTAQIHSTSLSSVAGRQISLTLPPSNTKAPAIPDGGSIPLPQTTSEVDLDQIFNTLSPKTINDFKHVIQGFDISYSGVAPQANAGFKYANPFLSTSRRVFDELTLDTPALERLLVDTSHLSGALAQRAPDLSLLTHNLNSMMGALASQKVALAQTIAKLPPFMRQADTTFVNLRAALDDLDPLVNASKPVADRLGPFFANFRAAARDSVPTIRSLDQIVNRPGAQNDLTELTRDAVPLAKAGVGTGSPDCGSNPATDFLTAADNNFKQGALGESTCALQNGLPALSFFRPYTPELVGWFNDFGTSGVVDANGGIGRIGTTVNTFSLSSSGVPVIPSLASTDPCVLLPSLPLCQAGNPGGTLPAQLVTKQYNRCAGALERDRGDGSTPFTDGGNLTAGPGGCDPNQVPTGP
jgi:phospholipid/cholesterol/gamma-HCH transport system substrate-binding protein